MNMLKLLKSFVSRIYRRKLFLFLSGTFLVIGFISGLLSSRINERFSKSTASDILHEFGAGGRFTNPILDCQEYSESGILKFKPLKVEIESIQDRAINEGKILESSIYFRDLNNGPWLGIDFDTKFTPASLLKVPIMIAYLKKAETDPLLLQRKLKIEIDKLPSKPLEQTILPTSFAANGKEYTVDELIRLMIINSDNNANYVLSEYIGKQSIYEVFVDLGIKLPQLRVMEDFLSVREYVTFFRVLYNSSYLNREMSEKALSLLSKSEYKDGITKLLPRDVVVAHKFGERVINDSKTGESIRQLHDCGIVYYSKSPYLLCVMTRGDDFQKMSQVISEISHAVYKYTTERVVYN